MKRLKTATGTRISRTNQWSTLMFVIMLSLFGEIEMEVVEKGPASGIVLLDTNGVMITECRVNTQRLYVKLDPKDVYRKHMQSDRKIGEEAKRWTANAVREAQLDTIEMLRQVAKSTITHEDLMTNRRPKRFLGALMSAVTVIGSLLSIGTSAANTISISALRSHVKSFEEEMPIIRQQLKLQQYHLEQMGTTQSGTVTMLNLHSTLLNRTLHEIEDMNDFLRNGVAHVNMVRSLLQSFGREVNSALDLLSIGRIPSYLVSLQMVSDILRLGSYGDIEHHLNLAFSLGSAIPIYVNPERFELGFIINVPAISPRNIYRLKSLLNVGYWQNDTYIKIEAPSLVAYQEHNPNLLLSPDLKMCTLAKSIHWLCPSKPFLKETNDHLCGIRNVTEKNKCQAEMTPKHKFKDTLVERVGNRWLVSTAFPDMTITYPQHITHTTLPLPNYTVFITVPDDAVVRIGDLTLHHLNDELTVDIELPPFSPESIQLNDKLKDMLRVEGTKLVKLQQTAFGVLEPQLLESRPSSLQDVLEFTLSDLIGFVYTTIITIFFLGVCWRQHQRVRVVEGRMIALRNVMAQK